MAGKERRPSLGPDAAEVLKVRLRNDLRLAMLAKLPLHISVLRSVLAALDNAQAVPVDDLHDRYIVRRFGEGAAEVPRLRLTAEEVEALLRQEIIARQNAAAELAELNQSDRADNLRIEAEIISRYASHTPLPNEPRP